MIIPILKPGQQRRKRHDVIDGIQYRISKATGVMQEFCVTTAARSRRRWEIFERAKGHCEKCGRKLRFDADKFEKDAMHWSHKQAKGMGGANGDDSLQNGECLCRDCHLIGVHKQF